MGTCIIVGSILVSALFLASAVAWGPHHCVLQFPKVIGCALGSYESLSGGLFAAGAAIFAGWLAWSAVQVQISAEERRSKADRIEVERVLAEDIDRNADGLAGIWKVLEGMDEKVNAGGNVSEDADLHRQAEAVVWGIEEVANDVWLKTARNMVQVLGWERRRRFEELFSALDKLRELDESDSLDVFAALTAVRSASVYFELVEPKTAEYFTGLFRRAGKAWTLGDSVQINAGLDPWPIEPTRSDSSTG